MAKKKLIIVYDKSTEATANYLLQLISGTDDVEGAQVGTRDGNVDANIWSEKEYANNRPKLSSAQYVLFVGNNKTVRTLRENVTAARSPIAGIVVNCNGSRLSSCT